MNFNGKECKEVQALLPLHMGNDLEPKQSLRVQSHVDQCGVCAASLQEGVGAAELRSAFWRQDIGEAPTLWPAIQAQMEAERVYGLPETDAPPLDTPVLEFPLGTSANVDSGEERIERKPTRKPAGALLRPIVWSKLLAAAVVLAAVGLGVHFMGGETTVVPSDVGGGSLVSVKASGESVGTTGLETPGAVLTHFAHGTPAATPQDPLAGTTQPLPPTGEGLRRMADDEASLLEGARPWGLEETPGVRMDGPHLRVNPMHMAGGD